MSAQNSSVETSDGVRGSENYLGPSADLGDWPQYTWAVFTPTDTCGTPIRISTFNPDAVFVTSNPLDLPSLDSAVGITGYHIESLEDGSLLDGLTIGGGAPTPTSTIPASQIRTDHSDSVWDYSASLVLNADNTLGEIVVYIAGGASSVGFGVGDVESDVEVGVNGISFGLVHDLPNWRKGAATDVARRVPSDLW